MIEEFEHIGIWWLPDKPEKQVAGILRVTPGGGAILDLIGSFKDTKNTNEILKPVIILGVSSNGKKITLYKCFENNLSFSIPGFPTSSFYANVVFIGAHFLKVEDIKFKSISVHYSHLDEWVNVSRFDIKQLSEENGISIKYNLPEPFQANINDGLKILIKIYVTRTSFTSFQKEVNIKQKTQIIIETSEDKSFEYYRKIINHIQNFLSLSVMEPVYPLAITGLTEINKEMVHDKTVQIYYRLPDISKSFQTLRPVDMLFTFEDISNRFESFLKNWFEKLDLLEPVYNLYFGTLYNPHIYLEQRFLSLIQALESLHQLTYGGKYLSDEDYKVIYDTLVNAIPEGVKSDFNDRLKGYLNYGNDFSLRKRLNDIFDKYQEPIKIFIDNRKFFIDKVVNTRNYLTHYDTKLKKYTANGEELFFLTQKLKMCLEICLLSKLGFNSNEIKDFFSKYSRYNYEYFQY